MGVQILVFITSPQLPPTSALSANSVFSFHLLKKKLHKKKTHTRNSGRMISPPIPFSPSDLAVDLLTTPGPGLLICVSACVVVSCARHLLPAQIVVYNVKINEYRI